MKKKITWMVVNLSMAALLVFGLFYEVGWCQNVLKFVIWVNFVCMVLLLFGGKNVREAIQREGASMPKWVNLWYGVLYASTLASFGWFGYAAMDITVTFIQIGLLYGDKEKPDDTRTA